jgi:hypothetical protein
MSQALLSTVIFALALISRGSVLGMHSPASITAIIQGPCLCLRMALPLLHFQYPLFLMNAENSKRLDDFSCSISFLCDPQRYRKLETLAW